MSANVGTSTKLELLHEEVKGWKELTTITSGGINHLFALYEKSYEFLPGLAKELPKGTRAKLFLAVTKSSAFVVKYTTREQAAEVSEAVTLNLDLTDAERKQQEVAARATASGFAAFVDCGVFAATVGAGIYSGGVVLMFGGWLAVAASGTKCLTSGIKWIEHSRGESETWFDSGFGRAVDVSVTAIDAASGLKTVAATGKQALTYMRMAKNSPASTLSGHAGHLAKLRLAKLGLVDVVGVGLTGYDLLGKVGRSIEGWELQSVLNAHVEAPPPCDFFEPMLHGPADWLRHTLTQGTWRTPWSRECSR